MFNNFLGVNFRGVTIASKTCNPSIGTPMHARDAIAEDPLTPQIISNESRNQEFFHDSSQMA